MALELRILPDAQRVARAAAEMIVEANRAALRERGRFSMVLSGGKTPRQMYEMLATHEFSTQIDWSKTHVFWGDERCVPPDEAESNYGMAREALLARVAVAAENIHRMQGELEPQAAADAYEEELRAFFAGAEGPRFDVVLLGLGADGHTASLFPQGEVLGEAGRWAAAVYVEKLESWRLTLTPGIINEARKIIFLVAGAEKAEIVKQVLQGPRNPKILPAQIVRPNDGKVVWLVEEEAGRLL